jgi:hypothetical protein
MQSELLAAQKTRDDFERKVKLADKHIEDLNRDLQDLGKSEERV